MRLECHPDSPTYAITGRVELFALVLARHVRIPAIIVQGGECTPFMISPTEVIPRSPGRGTFTCCSRDHVMTDDHGVERTIPCDKDKISRVVLEMVDKRREFLLGSGDLFNFRLWGALLFSCMQGLSQRDMAPPPSTVAEFLAANRFDSAHDGGAKGLTPLMCAAMSGNVTVARELVACPHNADVKARVRVNDMLANFGFEEGCDALCMALGACPQHKARGIVSTLLEAGADPNARLPATGGTPLMGAVVSHSLEGVRALLDCAGEKLDLEIGLRMNNATALNLAGILGTYDIVEALLLAGANRTHR